MRYSSRQLAESRLERHRESHGGKELQKPRCGDNKGS
jgi:hypothetical protein